MMFSFTWLETERLHNEYRAIDLTREIRHVKEAIGQLRSERHRLSRLDRMEKEAPELHLVEAKPGQIKIVSVDREKLHALLTSHPASPESEGVHTRSAYLDLDEAGHDHQDAALNGEMARSGNAAPPVNQQPF